jgi:hypothetical protein
MTPNEPGVLSKGVLESEGHSRNCDQARQYEVGRVSDRTES